MQLNLPILDQLQNSTNILLAGAGGGFDIYAGMPIYFALKDLGKSVHLANLTFSDWELAIKTIETPTHLVEGVVLGVQGKMKFPSPYFPEGYLTEWLSNHYEEPIPVWMLAKTGARTMQAGYQRLIEHLGIDAIILVDGGVDSIMRGDETTAGTLFEDSISLAAVHGLAIPTKILACIGFSTEVEEELCHHSALENMAGLAKAGGFLGSCALTPQMPVFQRYRQVCENVWQLSYHSKGHISPRIIPAVEGEFGDYHLFKEDTRVRLLLNPLMGLYWFYKVETVFQHNEFAQAIVDTLEKDDVLHVLADFLYGRKRRPRRQIPF